ncbi:MAG TPA: AMP-binding protein, partial [Kofleriaceae bacterium]|nr:AMP-binding protein [Kofleriaceae bacterium]
MARDGGVGSWIERRARRSPERIAIVHGGVQRTYRELAARIIRLANALRDHGVGRGDRVVWLGANHPAFLELLFATAKLGAVLAPINHRLDPGAIETISRNYEPVLVVTDPAEVEQMIVTGGDGAIDEAIALDTLCILHHTSGTTGTPKGIMLTHGNVTWNVINFLSVADFREDDRTVAIAPFFRSGGLGVNVLTVLFKGGTVIVPETATPEAILDAMTVHRVTIGFGNPDLLDALTRCAAWPNADLSSIRAFMTGGAPVPERLLRTYLDRGITFLQGYGLSEAAPLVLLLDPDHALRKVGSAGTPPL